ncbi:MAG: sucrase ferredoxin [Candidatus Limnocylindria bacterium]
MTLTAPQRCSALAEELDEPMVGTVQQRTRWLLIEDRSAWGHDAVGDLLGPEVSGVLKDPLPAVGRAGRGCGRSPSADVVRSVFLVDTAAAEMAVREVRTLTDLEASALASMPVAEFGAPVPRPLFLVCSNGKRDACCAVRGRTLLTAMAAGHVAQTWECTHLGGHRFAANLVCLPHGIVYGRVTAADGPRLADEYLAGRLDAASLRGRSAWPEAAQVAEHQVRLADGLRGVDDVGLVSIAIDNDRAEVTLAVRGRPRVVALHATPLAPRTTSCRADEMEQPVHWRVV